MNFFQSPSVEDNIDIGATNESAAKQFAPVRSARLSVARALDFVIFVSLLATIALTAVPYGTVQPWLIALFECVIFLLGILGIIEGLVSKRWSTKNLSLATPLVALVLFILCQSFSVSADPYNTRLVAARIFALILAGGLLLVYTSSKRRLWALISVAIGVALASALFGVVRKYFQQGPGFLLPALSGDRGFAQFINRNHFGFLIEMAWGLTLGLLFTKTVNRRRIFILLPAAAFLWIVLIISNSRGGIVASLGQVLFLGVLLDPLRHLNKESAVTAANRLRNLAGGLALRVVLILGMVALFAYGALWVGGESVVTNFQLAEYSFSQQGMDEQQRANTSRKDIWSSTWRLIKSRPLAGSGFGGYWIAITKYHNASGDVTPQEAHNDYLELLASGGLIGLALVLWFAVAFVKRTRITLRSQDPYLRAAALGALVGIFGVMIHSFVDFGLHVTSNALILCALIVIAVQRPDETISAGSSRA